VILAAVDGSMHVVMGIADELKPNAAASIMHLEEVMKMDVWMVTGGDNVRTLLTNSCRKPFLLSRSCNKSRQDSGHDWRWY
jgi:hypothetical protein